LSWFVGPDNPRKIDLEPEFLYLAYILAAIVACVSFGVEILANAPKTLPTSQRVESTSDSSEKNLDLDSKMVRFYVYFVSTHFVKCSIFLWYCFFVLIHFLPSIISRVSRRSSFLSFTAVFSISSIMMREGLL
jgi:hypothetical protein